MENRLNLQSHLRELTRQVDVNLLSVLHANWANNIDVHMDTHTQERDLNVRCQLSVTTLNQVTGFLLTNMSLRQPDV